MFANAPIEQFLFWDESLTESEVTAIFNNANPYQFSSDKRIVLSFATPETYGTSRALSTSATGFFRNLDRTASLDIVTLGTSAGTISITTGFNSATHIVYGADTSKLAKDLMIATSTNLATASIYRVIGIKNTPGAGNVAYLVKS